MSIELDPRRALRLFGRALLLRCPNCGSGDILASWLRLRDRCPRCRLALDRGEHDYFLGAMMFNLVAAELVFAAVFVTILVVTWPDPPWTVLQYGGVATMIAAPFIFFPFARTLWLAFDITLRPVTLEELESESEGMV